MGGFLLKRPRHLELTPEVTEVAWKAPWRLPTRYKKLAAANHKKPQIVTAVGREPLGFIGAIAVHTEAQGSCNERPPDVACPSLLLVGSASPPRGGDANCFFHPRGNGRLCSGTVTAVSCATPRKAGNAWIPRAHGRRRLVNGLGDGIFQSLNSLGHVLDFLHVLQQRGLPCRRIEVHVFLPPGHVLERPVFLHVLRRTTVVPPQELAPAVACARLILARIFARSHQLAQGFLVGIRNPYRRAITSPITARQFRSVAPIGLDAIARFDRNPARRHHFPAHSQRPVRCQYHTYPQGPAS